MPGGGDRRRRGAAPGGAARRITPYRDGPLIVRGDFRLLDQDGGEIDPGRETIALCRCGKSGIKPFCDGSHKRSGFSAPERAEPAPARCRTVREARRTEDDAPLVIRRVRAAGTAPACPTMCGTSRRAARRGLRHLIGGPHGFSAHHRPAAARPGPGDVRPRACR